MNAIHRYCTNVDIFCEYNGISGSFQHAGELGRIMEIIVEILVGILVEIGDIVSG